VDYSTMSDLKQCTKCGGKYPATTEHFKKSKKVKSGLYAMCRRCTYKAERKRIQNKRHEHICKKCGSGFPDKSNSANIYCSRECAFEDMKAEVKLCAVCGAETNGTKYCSDKCRHSVDCACKECDKIFKGKAGAVFCSGDCRRADARKKWRESFISVKQTNPYVTKACRHCGEAFTTNFMADNRVFCSEKCMRRSAKQQRNYRRRGNFVSYVSRHDVCERDEWTCQICGKKVDQRKIAPHPKSPTLDHIIPLAKGGTHEPKNVQLAHFLCNSVKGDRDGGQLRLF
jgi:hypothetical protein